MSSFPDTARSTAVALNNIAIDLLRNSAWNEAAKALHEAAHLMKGAVSNDPEAASDICNDHVLYLHFQSLVRTTEDQLHHIRSLGAEYRPRPACTTRENVCPVLIHSRGVGSTIDVEYSMVTYNYALALDCAGASEELVYRLLQTASSAFPRCQMHSYQSYLLQVAEQLLASAQRLGLQEDCIEHHATIETSVQLVNELNKLMQSPSASAA